MKPMNEAHLAVLRRHMAELIGLQFDLVAEEVGRPAPDARLMAALLQVPRHRFVPPELAPLAYHDTPLPIGFDKTISQPFIAALMIDLLGPQPHERVLEVGTGLGYQAALLAALAAQVWSVEVVEEFAAEARERFQALALKNVEVRVGDGSRGWAEHAPFDKILVTAAAARVPRALVDQLRAGGRMVLPVGPEEAQQLTLVDKAPSGEVGTRAVLPVRFTQLEVA